MPNCSIMMVPIFGKWRSFFWPIHRSELKKFLLLFFIFFVIAFNYNVLRSYKDSIIITASNSGAETIPFIKVWVVLPSAILFTLLFTRLTNWYSREKVFYVTLSIFLVFFALFALVLYPAQDLLHPNQLADSLQAQLPSGFKGFIAIFRNWTFTLFYVMSELWSTAVFTVLFWGFANEVTSIGEAKRFYGLLTCGGSLSAVCSGFATVYFSKNLYISWIPYGENSWDQSILFLCCTIVISGLIIIALFYWLTTHIVQSEKTENYPKEKVRMSMRASFAYLARSKYLFGIALIVFTYNVAINLVEIVWKDQMKALYPNPSEYNAYMGKVIFAIGVIATLTGLLSTTKAVQRFSWTTCALIPPIIIGVTGMLFFNFIFFPGKGIHKYLHFLSMSPLILTVTLGSAQNCLSRASKYTFFDATKEIAFIPLDKESKLKGKAAIDGVGSRIGKSGGSVLHQGLILIMSTVSASIPYIAVIFFFIILIWGFTVVSLGRKFDKITSEQLISTKSR